MYTAFAITLFFVAATLTLGGVRNLQNVRTTGQVFEYLGALVAGAMTIWRTYPGIWVLNR